MMFKKRVLVTGAKGFIGSRLVKELKKNKNYEVFGIDRENKYDYRKFPNANYVFHFGANTPFNGKNDYDKVYNEDIIYTKQLCNFYPKAKIIFPSGYFTETSLYRTVKQLCVFNIQQTNDYVILKLPPVYGPGQKPTGFIHEVTIGKKSMDDRYKNFIYIDEAIEKIIKSMKLKNVHYNIVGDYHLWDGIEKYREWLFPPIYIDLDGTLTDLRHRQNLPTRKGFVESYETLHHDKLLKGIKPVLTKLNKRGHKLILLTARYDRDLLYYTLGRFGIGEYFDEVINTSSSNKKSFIKHSKFYIVGDTEQDIEAGKINKGISIGVLTGCRTREQLEKAKPDYILNSIHEIFKVLDGEKNGR